MKPTLLHRGLQLFFVLLLAGSFHRATAQTLSINLGPDTLIALKQSGPTSLTLQASVVGSPLGVLWSRLTGDAGVSISTPSTLSTVITGLKEGVYSFKCDLLNISGVSILSDVVNVRVVDYQRKNRIPCRTGAPQTFILSATSTTDLIKPYVRRDGMDVQGGDTIKINRNPNNGGIYGRIYLGDFGGDEGCPVIVVPNGQIVEISGPSHRFHLGKNNSAPSDSNFVNHVVLDGTYLRNQGIEYGFQSTGTGWGLATTMVTDVEIKGFLFENNSLGIQMKVYSDSSYAWTVYDNFIMKNIKIHDNYFHKIASNEGMYIGHTSPSGVSQANNDGPTLRMDSVFIYKNVIDSTGWDAMQTSNARYVEMHDNVIMHSAVMNASSQNWGLLMGGNCTGKIYNNLVFAGTSATVGSLGYGTTDIFYNYIGNTSGSGIYVNGITTSILEANQPGRLPPMQLTVRDNIISGFEAFAIHHANNERRAIPGSIRNNYMVDAAKSMSQLIADNAGDALTNNNIVRSFPVNVRNIGNSVIGPRLQITQGTAIDTFTNSKDAIDWLFSRLSVTPPANISPNADAGADKVITLPVSNTSLSGAASSDPDGTITAWNWTKISGPSAFVITTAAASQTTVTGLVAGVYEFRLLVTDNAGATDADTVRVTVNAAGVNTAPTARAGADQAITLPVNTVTVSGAASTDANGTITGYAWSKISGPSAGTITSPAATQTTITALAAGTYKFRLVVTDNAGATGSDTMTVLVTAASVPGNTAPNANAGNDQSITLPLNSVSISGTASTDADGTITAYSWTRISGPAASTITTPTSAQTSVTGLVEGSYQFRLLVQDNSGAQDADTLNLTVNPVATPPNLIPVANAGSDQTLRLPVNSTQLTSSSTDADGTIVTYRWARISGPASYTLTSAGSATASLTDLVEGVYVFRLTVTDNRGGSANDNITITVLAAVVANQPPTVNAGGDIVVLMPNTAATISGAASDPDGFIASTTWRVVGAGHGNYDLQSPGSLESLVAQLEEGVYDLELRAIDNGGLEAADTMSITVRAGAPSSAVLYPNPSAGEVTLKIDANTMTSMTSIKIYNAAGRLVHQEQFMRSQPSVTHSLNLARFAPGIYFVVTLVDIDHQITNKLIRK